MTTQNKDFTIREVSEIGFSPYMIFRDVIKDEYNHVFALYFNAGVSKKLLDTIEGYYDLDKFDKKTYTSFSRQGEESREQYYYSVEKKIFISMNVSKADASIVILATEDSPQLLEMVKKLSDKREKKKSSSLNIICYDRSFYTEAFTIKNQESDNFDFFDCYNDGFEDIHKEILNKLSVKNGKGIALFHGDIGTGKTSYLRKLITSLPDKKIIYMPPDLTDRISSPEFVTFLMQNPNSILFIEDAENVLKAREATGRQSVSNLLNVSDGILGDALHLQIVCTFNCPLDHIDSALLRPGRLIGEYRFENLQPTNANRLIKKLYGDQVEPVKQSTSLATIFNMTDHLVKTKEKKVSFGFTAG